MAKTEVLEMIADNMQMVPVGDLKRYPKNPRIGNLEGIKESIKKNGFAKVLLVQKSTMYVLDGNHTWQAATELGYKEVPCSILDVDDDNAARIVLAANRLNDQATYDVDLLAEVLQGLDSPQGTGYSDEDYAALMRAIDTDTAIPDLSTPDPVFGGDGPVDLGMAGDDDSEAPDFDDIGGPEAPELDDDEGDLEKAEEDIKGGYQLRQPEDCEFEGAGYWGIPALRSDMLVTKDMVPENLKAWAGSATKDWPDEDQWWLYNVGVDSTSGMHDVSKVIVSFYTWDHYFESWWVYPDRWVGKLLNSKIKMAITPDFSQWAAKPMVESLYNLYRNRWIGRYMQDAGIKVIPNISWPFGDRDYYDKHVRATLPKKLPVVAMQMQTFDEELDEAQQKDLKDFTRYVIEDCDADLTIYYTGKQGKEMMEQIMAEGLKQEVMVIPFRTEALAEQAKNRSRKTTL